MENDIQQLREEFERKAQASREAQDNLSNAKENDMKGQIKRLKDLIQSKANELSNMQSKMDTISQKLSALEGEKFGYQQIIRDLQKKIQEESEAFEQEKHRLERENDDLRGRMDNLIKVVQMNKMQLFRRLSILQLPQIQKFLYLSICFYRNTRTFGIQRSLWITKSQHTICF